MSVKKSCLGKTAVGKGLQSEKGCSHGKAAVTERLRSQKDGGQEDGGQERTAAKRGRRSKEDCSHGKTAVKKGRRSQKDSGQKRTAVKKVTLMWAYGEIVAQHRC